MRQWDQPGLAIAAVGQGMGGSEFISGFGERNRDLGGRVDGDTVFALASCTKPFAAATVALLVDDGTLSWDDPVDRFAPWFHAPDEKVTRALTVRDLLSQRSGLQSQATPAAFADRRAFLATVRTSTPIHPFRAQYRYADEMFTLAGEVVASTSGESWGEFARRRLFLPLGMRRTITDYRVARAMPNAASPHRILDGQMRPVEWLADDIATPATGLYSSARDLAARLRFQLAGGVPIMRSDALVQTRNMQTTLEGPFYDSPFGGVPGVTNEGYGLGWFMMDYHDEQILYHHGSLGGFRCFTAIVPDRQVGFAALGNSWNAGLLRALFLTLVDELAGREPLDWSSRMLARHNTILQGMQAQEARLIAERGAPAPPTAPLVSFTGRYDDGGPIGQVSVELQGQELSLRMGRLTYSLRHWTEDTFEAIPQNAGQAEREAFVTFEMAQGSARRLRFVDRILERQH